MQTPLFKYLDYKQFLKQQIHDNSQIKAYRTLLAKAAGCQRSYLSQVLGGKADLTLDHAAGLTQFWKFDRDEVSYFLELVSLARAVTPKLKKIVEYRIQHMRQNREDFAQRFAKPSLAGSDGETSYYSNGHFAALHVLTSVPQFQRDKILAAHLGLPLSLAQHYLKELQQIGLVESVGAGSWKVSSKSIHVPKNSIHSWIHHSNWRHQAIRDAQIPNSKGVHYTALHGLSLIDMNRIREKIMEFIDETRKIVEPSPEEVGVCLGIDFFEI